MPSLKGSKQPFSGNLVALHPIHPEGEVIYLGTYARCGFSLQGLSYYLKVYRVFVPRTQESYDVALDQAIHYSKGDAAGNM